MKRFVCPCNRAAGVKRPGIWAEDAPELDAIEAREFDADARTVAQKGAAFPDALLCK